MRSCSSGSRYLEVDPLVFQEIWVVKKKLIIDMSRLFVRSCLLPMATNFFETVLEHHVVKNFGVLCFRKKSFRQQPEGCTAKILGETLLLTLPEQGAGIYPKKVLKLLFRIFCGICKKYVNFFDFFKILNGVGYIVHNF